ncbi:MAG TPA: isochorismatase family cysteine hydrolase [Rhodopila sp.]
MELGASCVHLCCDVQRMFLEDTPWHTSWMSRILPQIRRIAEAHPANTIFTRFIPAARPGEGNGMWKRYWQRWSCMTIEHLGYKMIDLVPELAALVPPAEVVDKQTYSPWIDTDLHSRLQARGVDSIIVTGSESDVCVLATVLGAIDHGYRVLVPIDAICSSADETHDASLQLYSGRYGEQVETATTDEILSQWKV